jgi:glutamate racemase
VSKIINLRKEQSAPIGVFDSGIGGLTILSALKQYFPHESFIYYADNGNIPYGNKSKEQIQKYSRNIISWFQNIQGAKMVAAACNTSSALALEEISAEFAIPIIGTINPIVQTIFDMNCTNLGIIATPATVSSKFHEETLRRNGFRGKITAISCPEFAPLIESNNFNPITLAKYAKEYLKPFQNNSIDTLIYGCTHYPLIKDIIEPLLSNKIKTLCPSLSIVQLVKRTFNATNVAHNLESQGCTLFYCNRDKEDFERKIRFLTEISNPIVKCVSIEKEINQSLLFEAAI